MAKEYILSYAEREGKDIQMYNYVFDDMEKLLETKNRFIKYFEIKHSKEISSKGVATCRYTATNNKGETICKAFITCQSSINNAGAKILDDDDVARILEEGDPQYSPEPEKKSFWPTGDGI